jgi:hypothetical protein
MMAIRVWKVGAVTALAVVTISVNGAGPTHRDMVVVYDLDEPSSPRPGPVDGSPGPPEPAARGL